MKSSRLLTLQFLIILATSEAKKELFKLPNGNFYIPGKACGTLKVIKYLHQVPVDLENTEECTIVELNNNRVIMNVEDSPNGTFNQKISSSLY